ncbi:MAG TPA: hypothetical protein VGP96_16390 [Candidatus Dormibacteraeota bacterium]|nr:hypothetical protein [Candidatus Dormibacteraeota bacterium]
MRSSTLWVAGATAVSIGTAATAAAAGPLGHQRLAAAPGTGSPAMSQPLNASLAASDPDLGRRKGNPGAAPTPVAKVVVTEASSGQAITVKPGTEIDVTLKPDSGQRWSQPRSDHPQAVGGGRAGGGWGGPGGRQATPDLGPGGRRDGSTHAVFLARGAGDATLSSAERSGGLLKPPTTSRSWSVKVTVSGPAPAGPKPKAVAPAAVEPAAQAAPATVDVSRMVTPVAPAVRRLLVTVPRL